MTKLRLLLLFPLAGILACGSTPTSQSSSTTATPYDFNGNWSALTTDTAYAFPFQSIGGALQVSNGVVTGTLNTYSSYISGNIYLSSTVTTPTNVGMTMIASGTLDASHNLTLTFPIAGGTGTLLATLADDPSTYEFGTWQIEGGACAMSVTPMEIKGTPTNPYTASPPARITGSLSGNWSIGNPDYILGSTAVLPITGFAAALQFSNANVSGTILPYANSVAPGICYHDLYGLGATAVTGTLDANNNLTLTAPLDGGTATITATLGSNPQTLADGNYQIIGGPCATSATPMTISQYAPLAGTYIGTFNTPNPITIIPVAGSDITVTAVLTESTTANANGGYPVTGTYTATGTGCTDSGIIAASTVTGAAINSSAVVSPGMAVVEGPITPTASAILNAYFISGKCGGFYRGNLVRQ